MSTELSSAPVLFTPDTHILSEVEPATRPELSQRLSDDQINVRYEITRTIKEIKDHRWKRIALQFPDHMLSDSARVYQLLARGLHPQAANIQSHEQGPSSVESSFEGLSLDDERSAVKLTILGDTSYGACCVDEIAAEHINADAVIHYGRACLSPTERLPVVHIFTSMDLDLEAVIEAFKKTFRDPETQVIITADTPYAEHIQSVTKNLLNEGFSRVVGASIVHDPSSLVPNRSLPDFLKDDPAQLNEWHLFHISEPPTSLLLTLSSRLASIHIYSTGTDGPKLQEPNTANILRRRYALITSLATVSTWGILINTLSVKSYLHIVDHVKKRIAEAGKKSYLFVVGKLNAAKVANFAEIGGWVVVGCWESSLIDSKDFFKPIITPFELNLTLAGDEKRVWTGAWRSDFQGILDQSQILDHQSRPEDEEQDELNKVNGAKARNWDSEEESTPPEFDLRSGRYVSQSRPLAQDVHASTGHITMNDESSSSKALTKRSNGNMLAVKGVASPAAEFLAQKRTWKGLGSDFEIRYEDDEMEGGLVEEGRRGVARGYKIGESERS